MKIDGAVLDEDPQHERATVSDELSSGMSDSGECAQRLLSHNLRASLAIVNGYSAALSASFEDLSAQYGGILSGGDEITDSQAVDRLMTLDADCRFCLSRLKTSIDQLKQRLRDDHQIFGADPQE